MDDVNIRLAKSEDAQGILEAQYSAVHDTASAHYPDVVRCDWAPEVTCERVQEYPLKFPPCDSVVVAEVDGCIAGFAALVPAENMLRDLYVAAKFGRRGIGSNLLEAIEQLAKEKGCTHLHINATLTAKEFYLRHGYGEIEPAEYTFSSGRKAQCVKMRKVLERTISGAQL